MSGDTTNLFLPQKDFTLYHTAPDSILVEIFVILTTKQNPFLQIFAFPPTLKSKHTPTPKHHFVWLGFFGFFIFSRK